MCHSIVQITRYNIQKIDHKHINRASVVSTDNVRHYSKYKVQDNKKSVSNNQLINQSELFTVA